MKKAVSVFLVICLLMSAVNFSPFTLVSFAQGVNQELEIQDAADAVLFSAASEADGTDSSVSDEDTVVDDREISDEDNTAEDITAEDISAEDLTAETSEILTEEIEETKVPAETDGDINAAETEEAAEETIAAETEEAGEETIAAETEEAGEETVAAETEEAGEETIAAETEESSEETIAAETEEAGEETIAAKTEEVGEETIAVESEEAGEDSTLEDVTGESVIDDKSTEEIIVPAGNGITAKDEIEKKQAGDPRSGTLSNGVSWELTGISGALTLTISGIGDISTDYYQKQDPNSLERPVAPWDGYIDQIIRIIVEEGITEVGYFAFYGMPSLLEVILPDGLSVIGYGCFDGCPQLHTVNLPDSLQTIEQSAFRGAGLVSIEIPDNVTSLGSYVFDGCTKLRSIKLPDSIDYIGWGTFSNTAITEFTIPRASESGYYDIGAFTFDNCSKLKKIVIPLDVSVIHKGVFRNCVSLTDVYYEGTASDWQNITIEDENDALQSANLHTTTVPVTSVKINSTARTMTVGKTFQLAAWPQPVNATDKRVTWHSFNTAVAKVSSTGLVTAVGKGTTNVRVMTVDGGKIAYCKVTVTEPTVPVTSVKINTTAKTLEVGKTFQLAAWPQPTNATNKAVTWYSFNTAVATVSSTGLVTAKGKGSTNVRVMTKDGGKIAYCKITVTEPTIPVTSVKINTTAKTLTVGKTFQLAAWPQPTNATNKAVTWYSFNTAVATVSSTGLVTAKGKGSTNVRVMTKDGGKIAYCKITVTEPVIPVSSVKINTTARTLEPGKTFQLAAWPQPANATNKAVTWTSSNTAIAKVSSTGLVTAVKAGSANITVKTADGGYTATCKITVKQSSTIPDGYSVSAPEDVHWTDDFRIAWTLGKMQDGSVCRKYRYMIYNAATGTMVSDHTWSTSSTSKTSTESALSSNTIDGLMTGSYYFTVYAMDDDKNQISPETRSNTKSFTRPNERLPKPTNVRWSGTKVLFDIPDSYKSKTNHYLCRIYYDSEGDGSYDRSSGKTGKISDEIDMSSYMTGPGYYKATLRVYNTDPQVILPSEIVELPVIYFSE